MCSILLRELLVISFVDGDHVPDFTPSPRIYINLIHLPCLFHSSFRFSLLYARSLLSLTSIHLYLILLSLSLLHSLTFTFTFSITHTNITSFECPVIITAVYQSSSSSNKSHPSHCQKLNVIFCKLTDLDMVTGPK